MNLKDKVIVGLFTAGMISYFFVGLYLIGRMDAAMKAFIMSVVK